MLKKWELSVCIGLIAAMLLSLCGFSVECAEIRTDVLRLHILANSDSERDQQLKLLVRDHLLEYSQNIFNNCKSVEDATSAAAKSITLLEKEAVRVIRQNGFDYNARVELAPSDFTTRSYGNVTLPAGEYVAVRVLIGAACGQNWWCVMYPSLCLPAACASLDSLDESKREIVTNRPKYEMRFKLVELFEQVKSALYSDED